MKIDILIPVWGERYVRRFAAAGLRSLLAPRNLPAISRDHEVTLTLITARCSSDLADHDPNFRRARTFCTLRIIVIDDLIARYGSSYSTILTRSYNRAMASSADYDDTAFVLLVGDLFFSDGALGEILSSMESGHDACLLCSPRLDAAALDAVLPTFDTGDAISVPPDEMVRWLVDYPHATMHGKTVEPEGVRLQVANQLYWRAGDRGVVARCFLLHMICIKPTRRPRDVAAPSDYAFISEFAADGTIRYLNDPRTFMAVELQGSAHELENMRDVPLSGDEVVKSLSFWVTEHHLQNARQAFVFCDDMQCQEAVSALVESDRFMKAVTARLTPREYRHHPFWLGSIGASPCQEELGSPDTLDMIHSAFRAVIESRLRAADSVDFAVVLSGERALRSLVHKYVPNCYSMQPTRFVEVMEDVCDPNGSLLVVALGGASDFLTLFGSRDRTARLVNLAGQNRSLLLGFETDEMDLLAVRRSRRDIISRLELARSLAWERSLIVDVHDMSRGLASSAPGFFVEIASEPGSTRRGARADVLRPDLLLGQRSG